VQSYSLNRSACKILGYQPDKKRSKKIMDVLGMDVLGANFSQTSIDDPNVLSCPSVTPSIIKESLKIAKVTIKKQDIRIKELEDRNHVNIKKDKYVPPPKVLGEKWPDGRCYFGEERLLTDMERKHHWLHYLNGIPAHCRSDSEKANIKSLFSWFEMENLAGNIGGEKCGLGEMWIFPPKEKRTFIHTCQGLYRSFKEFPSIICKGESPSLEEGIAAMWLQREDKRYRTTYFEEDDYMISVPQDIIKYNFHQNINQNASMWITSGGVVLFAYKSERSTLMLFTVGSQNQSDKYASCHPPNVIMPGKNAKVTKRVHRIMMMVISPISDKSKWKEWEVDHIDQVCHNNTFSNLCWVLAVVNKTKFHGKFDVSRGKKKRKK
jgi:hypothetical protein